VSNLPIDARSAASAVTASTAARPPETAGGLRPDAGSAESFRATMNRALERSGGQERSSEARFRPEHGSAFESAVRSTFSSLEHRFARLQRDSLDIGAGFDVSRPESVVLVHERQVRLTSALIEYQCVVQGAENVKNAIKSLTQMQG
jgi:hypothetical protein